ncbi:MAG: lytic transglycosylase domain-containing protein [Ruminococcaceae bacterium]|nr:lytic transglycosylase domain-containing protein [Oscillospiraceae bacterium]
MKKALLRSMAVLMIIALSLGIGLLYTRLYERYELKKYPCEFSEYVTKYSDEFGVPEGIIYSVIKTESDFKSNARSYADAVGLMQITSDTCDWVAMKLGEKSEFGLMYEPETNIRYGTYLISYLKLEYENWDTVFAAYNAGIGNVNKWLEDERYSDGDGVLKDIPFAETKAYVEKVNETRSVYKRLYPTLDY